MSPSRCYRVAALVVVALAALAAGLVTPTSATPPTSPGGKGHTSAADMNAKKPPPRFDHVMVVVFENKNESSIIGSPDAPYINGLAGSGALFTQSTAITHPSQPNYVALFSGSTQGLTDDSCPHTFQGNNQAHEMIEAGLSFTSYAEDLPSAGDKVCVSGEYARKHAPWANFPNVPDEDQQPFTSYPSHYQNLPTVSWVIPNLCSDMHDCSISTGDTWLRDNIGGYATWATLHNSLLIITFDENDGSSGNQIATIFYGAHVSTGTYDEPITHYSVLRTMEDMYGVARLGQAKHATTINDVWN